VRTLRMLPVSALLALAVFALSSATYAGTLDRMRQENLIRLAYRADAPPFSYNNKVGDAAGYMVELC